MPNTTVPAAATGLPNRRREFLCQLLYLPFAVSGAALISGSPAFAGNIAGHPDAEIFRLIDEHEANEVVFNEFLKTAFNPAQRKHQDNPGDEFATASFARAKKQEKAFMMRSEGYIKRLCEGRPKTIDGLKAKAAFHQYFEQWTPLPELQASIWQDIRNL
jgi:hypothetical protein